MCAERKYKAVRGPLFFVFRYDDGHEPVIYLWL